MGNSYVGLRWSFMIWPLISQHSLSKTKGLVIPWKNHFSHLALFLSSPAKVHSPRSWPAWLSPIYPLRLSISMQLPPFKNYFQISWLVFQIVSLYIQKSLHLPYYIIISIYMSILLNGRGREAYK